MRYLVIGDSSENWDFPEGHHFAIGVYDCEADGDIEDWLAEHTQSAKTAVKWFWNDRPIEIGEAAGHGDNSDDECCGNTLYSAYLIETDKNTW